MPAQPTKGEASDVISNTLNGQKGQNNGASGAAHDNTPGKHCFFVEYEDKLMTHVSGDVKPTGPSAKQPATNNQYIHASPALHHMAHLMLILSSPGKATSTQ